MKGKIGSKIRSIFLSHWLLKIMSLLLAFALWFVVISTNDPVDEKRFQNIKVSLLNTDLLAENGQVYEILDNTDVLRTVTFDAPRSVRNNIQPEDIIAVADLTNLTVTNTVEIRFSCPKYGDQVQNISGNIEYVKLNIEKETRKTVNIIWNVIGSVEEGYMVGPINLDRNRLEIQGPESAINEISHAEVDVDVTGITGVSTASARIRLVDESGNVVSRASVTQNLDTVNSTVEVWDTKEVPVVYNYLGTLAEDCQVTGMETSVEKVKIAGATELLNTVSQLMVDGEDLNVTGADEDYTAVLHLSSYLPKGIYFAEENFDDTAQVKILIEKAEEKKIPLRAENIQIINVPEGVTCEIVGSTSTPLVAKGLAGYMALLQSSTLSGVVDVGKWMENSNLSQPPEGEFSLPVEVSLLEEQEKISTPVIVLRFTPMQEDNGDTEEEL